MAGVDYVESSGMLTFPVGATEERFSVGLIDDRIAEGNEYLLIMLRDAWTEVDESPIAATILDDDPASANVELTLDRERVSEGEGPVALTVTAALDRSARGVDTAVEVALSSSGASGTVGYTAAEDFVLTIPEGALSGSASFTLRPENDRVDELDETIEVSGTSVLPVIPTSLLLEDDDEPSKSIVLAASPEVIAEDAGVPHPRRARSGEAGRRRPWNADASGRRLVRRLGAWCPNAGRRQLDARKRAGGHGSFGLSGYGGGPSPMSRMFGGSALSSLASPSRLPGWGGPGRSSSLSRYQGDQRWDLLARSSFSLSSSAGPREGGDGVAAGNLTAWGRGAVTDFRGDENDLSVRGEVVTGTVGVDYERGRWLTGLAMGLSRGRGGVGGNSDSGLEASLTTANPYARIRIGENLMLWGVLGYGRGEFSMTEDGTTTRTDLSLTMGALGFRRDLVSSARGFGLGLKSDVFLAQIDADAAPGLAAVSQDVNRVRLALETSYSRSFGGGGVLTPSFEIGVRHDGGDADQGRGVEMGVGLRYTDSDRGLRIEFAGRSLLTHQASGFEEWGGSGAVTLDPGKSGRGFALGLRSSWGAFHGGVQQLLSQGRMVDPGGRFGLHQGGRVEAEAGYGLGRAAGRVLVSPFGVVMLAEEGERGFGAGASLDFARMLSLSVEVSRRRSVREEPEDAVLLLGTLRLGPRSEPVKPVRANAAEASSASLPATPSRR